MWCFYKLRGVIAHGRGCRYRAHPSPHRWDEGFAIRWFRATSRSPFSVKSCPCVRHQLLPCSLDFSESSENQQAGQRDQTLENREKHVSQQTSRRRVTNSTLHSNKWTPRFLPLRCNSLLAVLWSCCFLTSRKDRPRKMRCCSSPSSVPMFFLVLGTRGSREVLLILNVKGVRLRRCFTLHRVPEKRGMTVNEVEIERNALSQPLVS